MLLWVLPGLANSCLPTTNIYMIHKIKDIELADISRYRGELMGVAMIAIILFHVSLPRSDMFYGLRRMGNIGVDIFLFLSGMGLWFSWVKNQSVKRLRLRLLRGATIQQGRCGLARRRANQLGFLAPR